MARKNSGKETAQLGFNMGIMLPKSKPAPEPASESIYQPESDVAAPAELKGTEILTVCELTHRISDLLEEGIGMVWVEGEISNLRHQSSGHRYFTLKDETAQLSCVLFARTAAGRANVELRDGLKVQLYGQISVYQPRGQYQLMVRLVQAKGEGVLQARFEELKRRLAAEGLFDQGRKKPLPRFPRRIGVVTSPTGAAIRDFLNVLHRRHPGLRVVLHPVRVQGRGAADEIAAAIRGFSSASDAIGPVDVIVVTRGGGSIEDLWEFNEEVVARAMAESLVPVVCAVGHEIDFTIADFVADLRAPTPSAAAELLAADGAEVIERCRLLAAKIGREALVLMERHRAQESRLGTSTLFREPLRRLDEARQTSDRIQETLSYFMERRLEQLVASLATNRALLGSAHPGQRLLHARQQLSAMTEKLQSHLLHRLERDQSRCDRIQSSLSALNPEATLARGFSITRDGRGNVITDATLIKSGDQLRTQLAGGEIHSEVTSVSPLQTKSAAP